MGTFRCPPLSERPSGFGTPSTPAAGRGGRSVRGTGRAALGAQVAGARHHAVARRHQLDPDHIGPHARPKPDRQGRSGPPPGRGWRPSGSVRAAAEERLRESRAAAAQADLPEGDRGGQPQACRPDRSAATPLRRAGGPGPRSARAIALRYSSPASVSTIGREVRWNSRAPRRASSPAIAARHRRRVDPPVAGDGGKAALPGDVEEQGQGVQIHPCELSHDYHA